MDLTEYGQGRPLSVVKQNFCQYGRKRSVLAAPAPTTGRGPIPLYNEVCAAEKESLPFGSGKSNQIWRRLLYVQQYLFNCYPNCRFRVP